MKRRLPLLLSLTLLLLVLSISFADTPLSEQISSKHWSYPLVTQLIEREVLLESDDYNLGEQITDQDFAMLLSRIDSQEANTIIEPQIITRIEAIKMIVKRMGYDYLATQLKLNEVVYTDISEDKGYIKLAYAFGIIQDNSTHSFRPNDLLTFEEAVALLTHYQRIEMLAPEDLSVYYAISSYGQIDYIEDSNLVFFGWSRLEYSPLSTGIILNTTSENNNEYRIPQGYKEAIAAADAVGAKKYLMVAVKDDTLTLPNQEAVRVGEYIISNPQASSDAIEKIVTTLTQNSQNIAFDGVLMDIENLKGDDNATKYNLFLSTLKVALDAHDKGLAVAVHPERKAGLAYFDGYDYRSIGSLSDYVVLMAHDYYAKKLTTDEMASGMSITPLTPINDIYYALEAITDPEKGVQNHDKIILQFSFDTVQWKLIEGKIINEKPYKPTYDAIATRIQSGIVPTYSSDLKNPYLVFFNEDDGTRNVVWYEDNRSIQAKIDLALQMDIKHFAFWRLGTIPHSTEVDYFDVWDHVTDQVPKTPDESDLLEDATENTDLLDQK